MEHVLLHLVKEVLSELYGVPGLQFALLLRSVLLFRRQIEMFLTGLRVFFVDFVILDCQELLHSCLLTPFILSVFQVLENGQVDESKHQLGLLLHLPLLYFLLSRHPPLHLQLQFLLHLLYPHLLLLLLTLFELISLLFLRLYRRGAHHPRPARPLFSRVEHVVVFRVSERLVLMELDMYHVVQDLVKRELLFKLNQLVAQRPPVFWLAQLLDRCLFHFLLQNLLLQAVSLELLLILLLEQLLLQLVLVLLMLFEPCSEEGQQVLLV